MKNVLNLPMSTVQVTLRLSASFVVQLIQRYKLKAR